LYDFITYPFGNNSSTIPSESTLKKSNPLRSNFSDKDSMVAGFQKILGKSRFHSRSVVFVRFHKLSIWNLFLNNPDSHHPEWNTRSTVWMEHGDKSVFHSRNHARRTPIRFTWYKKKFFFPFLSFFFSFRKFKTPILA
jgi:hypothetical protein